MKEKLQKILEQTDDIHLPIPLDESEMAENRLVKKPVLETRLLDDMESLEHWETVTPYAEIELSSERCVEGNHSLKFTHPTNLNGWLNPGSHMYNPGRIYAVPAAKRLFDGEDWTAWNRLSAWVYPVAPGMKSITLRIQLFNDGVNKVPDEYIRDGAHNMSLKGNCWNHVVLEMPYLDRDKVTGVAFEYDMVGHEPEAVDHVTWYLDKLELQKVEADVYEGWIPAKDRISYSHSGYQPGAEKIAIASGITAKKFRLIETKTGRVVLEKEVERVTSRFGELQILDFTEIEEEGEYLLAAGEMTSRVFSIAADVWEMSVWKMLNFFLVLRCGYEVYGKHRQCHTDMLMKHGDQAIVVNGGWHDAGDLAQGFQNTAEATMALFDLARAVEKRNPRLFKRVLEEAKWGLDYVLKTRFGDGYRSVYSSCSIWTDGVMGTHDDIFSEPQAVANSNFSAAYAEALGADVLKKYDPDYANYALKIAREDFQLALGLWQRVEDAREKDVAEIMFTRCDKVDTQVCSNAVLAACMLYRLTQEELYREKAEFFAEIVMECQQQEETDWDIPMVGFFYQDRKRDLIWHHNHMSYAYNPDLAMRLLLETFPNAESWPRWYACLALSGEYYKRIMAYSKPYGIVPAGVYHRDEATELGMKVVENHPAMDESIIPGYASMVEQGIPLGKGYYLRVYPVWFSFRGNYNVMLSEGKSMSSGALVRNDYELSNAVQEQFAWIVGKNPICQSTMYGEGYDYIQLYAVQPGQTVGAISVGMMSHRDTDAPYWPQVNNATYKEVWVCPATKWMWDMADSLLPALVTGYLRPAAGAELVFTNKRTGKSYRTAPHERTGWYSMELPSGNYTMSYDGFSRNFTAVSGREYELSGELYAVEVSAAKKEDEVIVEICAEGKADLNLEVRVDNVEGISGSYAAEWKDGKYQLSLRGKIVNQKKPVVGVVIPNGDQGDRTEFMA